MTLFFPEQTKIVAATAGNVTTNGGVTFDNICLKNAHKVYIVAMFLQAVSHATTIQPVVGISDASCTTSITFAARWWKNADISASDTLVSTTAATSMACTAGATNQLLVIEIDCQAVAAQSATYDWLGATIATSAQATDFVTAWYVVETRYPQATPPAVTS